MNGRQVIHHKERKEHKEEVAVEGTTFTTKGR